MAEGDGGRREVGEKAWKRWCPLYICGGSELRRHWVEWSKATSHNYVNSCEGVLRDSNSERRVVVTCVLVRITRAPPFRPSDALQSTIALLWLSKIRFSLHSPLPHPWFTATISLTASTTVHGARRSCLGGTAARAERCSRPDHDQPYSHLLQRHRSNGAAAFELDNCVPVLRWGNPHWVATARGEKNRVRLTSHTTCGPGLTALHRFQSFLFFLRTARFRKTTQTSRQQLRSRKCRSRYPVRAN